MATLALQVRQCADAARIVLVRFAVKTRCGLFRLASCACPVRIPTASSPRLFAKLRVHIRSFVYATAVFQNGSLLRSVSTLARFVSSCNKVMTTPKHARNKAPGCPGERRCKWASGRHDGATGTTGRADASRFARRPARASPAYASSVSTSSLPASCALPCDPSAFTKVSRAARASDSFSARFAFATEIISLMRLSWFTSDAPGS